MTGTTRTSTRRRARGTRRRAASTRTPRTCSRAGLSDTPTSRPGTAPVGRRERWEFDLGADDNFADGDDSDDRGNKLDRGIPSEMRCFDTAKIYVKAGDGGRGMVAFRREAFVAQGGPYGGNGGNGGAVYFEADEGINSLVGFRKKVHHRAEPGGNGGGKKMQGSDGRDRTVLVPPGTVVRNSETGEVIAEMFAHGHREMIIPGGRGGRGNASFKTAKNKAPQIAENGEEGMEMWVNMELRLVADVGIIGVPNAGKSTLLAGVSNAKPKIADYPFTTIVPNLGVVERDYARMVFADIPGLLEGASEGIGLGFEFLRHVKRTRVLVHVLDCTSKDVMDEYEAIRNEIHLFDPEVGDKPEIIALNKVDASGGSRDEGAGASGGVPRFRDRRARRQRPGRLGRRGASHGDEEGARRSSPSRLRG